MDKRPNNCKKHHQNKCSVQNGKNNATFSTEQFNFLIKNLLNNKKRNPKSGKQWVRGEDSSDEENANLASQLKKTLAFDDSSNGDSDHQCE